MSLLLVLWPPPRIVGSVLAWALPVPPSAAEASAAEQSSHTQQERLLPTPTSRSVIKTSPTTHESAAAPRVAFNRDRRRGRGSEATFEKGRFNLSKKFRKKDFFRKPPGMVVTAPGTRAR